MSRLEDIFRNEAEIQIAKESHDYEAEVEYKPFTVRVPVTTLAALDNLARSIGKTRNDVSCDLICLGLEDAVRGYASAYNNPQEVYEQVMDGCVPEVEWGLPPKSEGTK